MGVGQLPDLFGGLVPDGLLGIDGSRDPQGYVIPRQIVKAALLLNIQAQPSFFRGEEVSEGRRPGLDRIEDDMTTRRE